MKKANEMKKEDIEFLMTTTLSGLPLLTLNEVYNNSNEYMKNFIKKNVTREMGLDTKHEFLPDEVNVQIIHANFNAEELGYLMDYNVEVIGDLVVKKGDLSDVLVNAETEKERNIVVGIYEKINSMFDQLDFVDQSVKDYYKETFFSLKAVTKYMDENPLPVDTSSLSMG